MRLLERILAAWLRRRERRELERKTILVAGRTGISRISRQERLCQLR